MLVLNGEPLELGNEQRDLIEEGFFVSKVFVVTDSAKLESPLSEVPGRSLPGDVSRQVSISRFLC